VYFVAHKSVLAVLITTVLAIGGCLPCQKLFADELSQKSCCNSKGECQRPSPETPSEKPCNLQLKDIQSEPQQHSERMVDGTLADAGEPITYSARVSYSAAGSRSASHIDTSPPSLFLLNLALLI